jgi:hypothetical protein
LDMRAGAALATFIHLIPASTTSFLWFSMLRSREDGHI